MVFMTKPAKSASPVKQGYTAARYTWYTYQHLIRQISFKELRSPVCHCPAYHFFLIGIPLVNEPIGSFQIQGFKGYINDGYNHILFKAMFSEGHNNGIAEGIPIDHTRRINVDFLLISENFW